MVFLSTNLGWEITTKTLSHQLPRGLRQRRSSVGNYCNLPCWRIFSMFGVLEEASCQYSVHNWPYNFSGRSNIAPFLIFASFRCISVFVDSSTSPLVLPSSSLDDSSFPARISPFYVRKRLFLINWRRKTSSSFSYTSPSFFFSLSPLPPERECPPRGDPETGNTGHQTNISALQRRVKFVDFKWQIMEKDL